MKDLKRDISQQAGSRLDKTDRNGLRCGTVDMLGLQKATSVIIREETISFPQRNLLQSVNYTAALEVSSWRFTDVCLSSVFLTVSQKLT